MSRPDLLLAEAKAAVGRTLAARSSDISVGQVRETLGPQLDAAIGDFAIQGLFRDCGFKALGGGMYRRAVPREKPPRPRRAK